MFESELKRLMTAAEPTEKQALLHWRETHPFSSTDTVITALWQIQQCILLAQQQKSRQCDLPAHQLKE